MSYDFGDELWLRCCPDCAPARAGGAALQGMVVPIPPAGWRRDVRTRVPSWAYARWEGKLPPLPPPEPPPGIWDRLASCEASGNWANVSNPKYKGGLQMDATFWARYGGLALRRRRSSRLERSRSLSLPAVRLCRAGAHGVHHTREYSSSS